MQYFTSMSKSTKPQRSLLKYKYTSEQLELLQLLNDFANSQYGYKLRILDKEYLRTYMRTSQFNGDDAPVMYNVITREVLNRIRKAYVEWTKSFEADAAKMGNEFSTVQRYNITDVELTNKINQFIRNIGTKQKNSTA